MPWRLIGIIAVFAVLLGFIGFNLDNTCNLSLGFVVFKDVPIYLTVLVSFMLGLFCSLPFFILGALKKKSRMEKTSKKQLPGNQLPQENHFPPETNESQTNGPYGID